MTTKKVSSSTKTRAPAKKVGEEGREEAPRRRRQDRRHIARRSPRRSAKTARQNRDEVGRQEGREVIGQDGGQQVGEHACSHRVRWPPHRTIDDEPPPAGGTSLVIVESPTKAKNIGKYLGPRLHACGRRSATCATCRPRSSASTSSTASRPTTSRSRGRRTSSPTSRRSPKGAREIFIATDPDREGEAIGWHVEQYLTQPKRQRSPRRFGA